MAKSDEQQTQIAEICAAIRQLLSGSEESAWTVGDLLVDLSKLNVGGKPLSLRQLHKLHLSNYSYTYLSQLRSTAEAFPLNERLPLTENGATWFECELARRSKANCVKARVADPDEPLSNFVEYIQQHKGKQRINQRDIMKARIERATEETRQRRAHQVAHIKTQRSTWQQFCHHASCLDVMESLDDSTVDLVNADPPYGAFHKTSDGRFADPETKGLEVACDNKTREEALSLTLGIIKRSSRVLKDTGKIVLFQAATEPDRPEIILLLRELGFDAVLPMYWKKRQPQPSDFRIPFSHETERVLVVARNREALWTPLAGSGRTDVIDNDVIAKVIPDPMEYEETPPSRTFYKEVSNGRAEYGDRHFFEKPLNLCKFFVEKLTLPGDTVLDVCGCTGSMIEACIEMDRQWIYCESHETNYNLGVSRIGEAMRRKYGEGDRDLAPIRA